MFLLVLVFVLLAQNTALAGDLPVWVNNISEECPPDNFCAMGSGENLEMAMSDARGNIQKIFATKISNTFKSNTLDNNNKVKSSVEEALLEESSGILKGVVIAETFQDGDTFFAFAMFNKITAAEGLKVEMGELDRMMVALLKDDSPSALKKLKDSYEKRRGLNEQYLFLKGKILPEVVGYFQIRDQERKIKNSATIYYLMINEEELKSIVKNLLGENNIKTTNDRKLANRIVIGSLTFQKEFLRVEGFKKYSAELKMDVLEKGVVTGTMNTIITDTGIDFDQVRSKIMKNLSIFMRDNFTNFID